MSYEKHVYATFVPRNLLELWSSEIRQHGITLDFYPEFEPASWAGGYLPCKLTVDPNAAGISPRYGAGPLQAGFELLAILDPEEIIETVEEYEEDMEFEGNSLPPSLLKRLRASTGIFCFTHGGFRWSAADFRACWFASASLAKVTDGLLFDEWAEGGGHGYCGAEKALAIAAERSSDYDESPDTLENAWDVRRFEAWEDQ